MRNERENNTTDEITRDYYKQLYASKLKNPDMDKFHLWLNSTLLRIYPFPLGSKT